MFLKSTLHNITGTVLISVFSALPALAGDSITLFPEPPGIFFSTPENTGQEVAAGRAVTSPGFDYGDPSPEEQLHLELLNRARMDPEGEAKRVGIDLFEGVEKGDITGLPSQPLTFNSLLTRAARAHSEDMLLNDYFSHYSNDGSGPSDRIKGSGYIFASAGENIAFIGSTGYLLEADVSLDLHNNLFIDENYPDRGHRVNILNPGFREVGIGLAYGDFSTGGYTYKNSFMVTCDFAASYSYKGPFILGVVYDDTDNDGFYDVGEGIGGVTLNLVETESSTASASAGGYAFPADRGSYKVEAVLEDGSRAVKSVTVSSENVKADFTLADFVQVKSTGCSAIDDDLNISIPCAVYEGSVPFSARAEFKYREMDDSQMVWALASAEIISESGPSCASIKDDFSITIGCARLGSISLRLELRPAGDNLWILKSFSIND